MTLSMLKAAKVERDLKLFLGQSPDQKQLIKELPNKTALYVEGAFRYPCYN
jgi:hypothetical protein